MAETSPSYDYLMEQERVNVMIVGGGGRERALEWKLAQSNRIGKLLLVPSGSGVVEFATDPDNEIDLAVIGPDDDLANGIVDDLSRVGIPAFGPKKQAAQIEAYRPYAKELMKESGVPTAAFAVFSDPAQAHDHIDAKQSPLYVKAAGLALGKGSLECMTADAAHQAVEDIMIRKLFGDAGNEVVVEDYLGGQEISLHAVCDSETYRIFPSSQDHKKADEGDAGLNTGEAWVHCHSCLGSTKKRSMILD